MKNFKIWQIAIIFFIICLFCEIFIFNFRAFTSLNYKENKIEISSLNYGDNIIYKGDNVIKVYKNKVKNSSTVAENGKYIEISNINQEVKNIYLDVEKITNKKKIEEIKQAYKIEATIWTTDEANELYFSLPKKSIVKNVERSKYINLNLAGESEKLRVVFENCNDQDVKINSISINKKIPFSFNIIRLIVIYAFVMMLYVLIPSNGFYEHKIDRRSAKQKIIIFTLAFINILVFTYFCFANPLFVNMTYSHHKQYNELTEALMEGYFHLNEKPSQALLDMENPYDYKLRDKIMKENNAKSRWDSALYNDKYYVYFGITPVLIYYLPAKIIFNIDFTAVAGIYISLVIFLIAVLVLMKQIINRWFKDTPFLIYLLLSFLIINSCGSLLYIKRPDFYSLPIAMAMMFSILGLSFWMSATKEKILKKRYLFLGSLCMALVAGCRPQMLLASFFAIPLFAEEVFKKRTLFSKKSIKETIIFMLPYIIFAAFLMYYNFARFGSPFDFGANYNLTTNDMTKRGFRLGRIPLGIFMYLFQPFNFMARFPFVNEVSFYTDYMGTTIREKMFGGIMFSHSILLLSFLIFKIKDKFPKRRVFYMALMGIIFTLIIVIADAQMAGILLRYLGDFSWFMLLSASLIALTLVRTIKSEEIKKLFFSFLSISFVGSFLYNAATLFILSEHAYYQYNPELHYWVMHSFEFWL